MSACIPSHPLLPVVVIGGGPVGLLFACTLARLMPGRTRIHVFDRRWEPSGSTVAWSCTASRRQQVVTVQSREFSALPPALVAEIFKDDASEVWPLGPGSVLSLYPRNVRIAQLEDALLAQARITADITLHAEEGDVRRALGTTPLIAIADGAHSPTRESLRDRFGTPDASLFSLGTSPVVDTCLGLRLRTPLSDGAAVVLTAAQRRLLLNPLRGEGYVNVRLTQAEADDLSGMLDAGGPTSRGYEHLPLSTAAFGGTALWQRLDEELSLFGVDASAIESCNAFHLDMVMRPRFVAPLCEPGRSAWRSYGCLIGDAANAIHFWPGRGINSGLMSAVSLARCAAGRWPAAATRPGGFRDSDFVRHEGVMHMLQYRHKTRAWRSMVVPDDDGNMVSIRDRIERSLREEINDQVARTDRNRFEGTVSQVLERLATRLPAPPDAAELERVVRQLSARTLHTLVASGPWDGQAMGGEEIDLQWLLPAAHSEPT